MLDQARAGAKYPEYSGSLHHQPPPLRRTPPQLLHIQRASCHKAAALKIFLVSPFASTKNVQGQNIPDNVLRCPLSGSVATNPNCPSAKTKDRVSTTEKGAAGQKELFQDAFSYNCRLRYIITHQEDIILSFKMPFLIIASSDTLLLIRRTSSCLSRCLFL